MVGHELQYEEIALLVTPTEQAKKRLKCDWLRPVVLISIKLEIPKSF